MSAVADSISVSIRIAASPGEVFPFFTDANLMMEWMADSAELDGRAGGRLRLEIEGSNVIGEFLEVDPPHRVRFSWGFEGSDTLPPGSSEVEVRLSPIAQGTLVELRHGGLRDSEAAEHRRGWVHFLRHLRRQCERSSPD